MNCFDVFLYITQSRLKIFPLAHVFVTLKKTSTVHTPDKYNLKIPGFEDTNYV